MGGDTAWLCSKGPGWIDGSHAADRHGGDHSEAHAQGQEAVRDVHHVLLASGFSQQDTLLMIAMLAVHLNFIGIVMYMLNWAAWIQFGVFWLLTGLYFATVEHAWRFGRWLQHQWGRDRHP